jgi:proteasome assembly chaperone (PAC2) family protein
VLGVEHIVWEDPLPTLRRPVLVAAFEGWNDAGDAASLAARYLRDLWDAAPVASIDPEEFYDFSSTRPRARMGEGEEREIVWPAIEVTAARVPGADRDVVFLLANEPQLRWRTFCEQATTIARRLGVELVITMGALLADVAHSRPVQVIGTATDHAVVERFGLQRSRYEGPTGIVGVLHDALERAGFPTVSLWAGVPAYMPAVPSPKAALALVERTGALLGTAVPTTGLEIATASYEREMDAAVEQDDELSAYLARLEEMGEGDDEDDELDEEEVDDGRPGSLVEEVERYLREHPTD